MQICRIQGDDLFERANYLSAAQSYAYSDLSLEETCLKFININENAALAHFIRFRLEQLPKSETAQAVLLTTWLLELYLSQMDKRIENTSECTNYLGMKPPESPIYYDETSNLKQLRLFFQSNLI
jgi:hypothetical protein